jgi:hypothetical protein
MTTTAIAKETVLVQPKLAKLGNLTLIRASDVGQVYGLNLLLYGQSGAGKTTLAASAQDSEYGADVLFLDLEGGTLSLNDRADIAVYRPQTFDEIINVLNTLGRETHTYKTIVIDSLTEAQVLAQESVVGKGKLELMTQQGWGIVNNKMLTMVRLSRELTHKRNINTIFTALERIDIDQTTQAKSSRPALTPGSYLSITAAVDSVGYLTFSPKDDIRILHFQGTGRFVAKVRQSLTNKRLPKALREPSMVDILAAMRGADIAEGAEM